MAFWHLPLAASVLALLSACGSGQRPPAAGASASARGADVPFEARLSRQEANAEAYVGSNGDDGPRNDMVWRLRNAVGALENYLGSARAALAQNDLPQTLRESLGDRVQNVSRALGAYRRHLSESDRRLARQAVLVDQLNAEFGARIQRYDQGQQVNFARELSLPQCDPLVVTDYKRAAELLIALSEVSLPVDAEVMSRKARYYLAVGPLVADLDQLKRQLFELKVVRQDNGRAVADLIGHPFQSVNNANWLDAYLRANRNLNRELERLGEPPAPNGCSAPACDLAIHRLAEAVSLRPPLDWAFLREGDRVMPPAPYGFSYFVQRYDANGEVRASLGLDPSAAWRWRSSDYVTMLDPDDQTLTFTHVFAEDKLTLSVADWKVRTEFPPPLPILYLVQEARRVVETLKEMPKDSRAARVRDIQFAEAAAGAPAVSLVAVPEGLRLRLAVLHPAGERPIDEVRAEMHEQIADVLRRADAVTSSR